MAVARPQAAVETDVEAIALVAPEKAGEDSACAEAALRQAGLARGTIYRHRFRDAKTDQFRKNLARAICRARRRRVTLAGHHRLDEAAQPGCQLRLYQGDGRRRPSRSDVPAPTGGRAGEAGLKRGAYHFFYWCRTAGEQADWFIRNVPRVEGALPPVIDVEYNGESRCKRRLSRARVQEKMQVFMDKLEAYYGQRPIIYTAPGLLPRQSARRASPTIRSGCAPWPSTRQRSIRAANGCSGSIPAPACRMA